MAHGHANPFKHVLVEYFDIGALGRGEVVRAFLAENGIPFEQKRVPFDDTWPAAKVALVETGRNPTGTVPVVEIDGKLYTEHIAICRYIARRLGLYGHDADLDYFTDRVCDAYQDWRTSWVADAFSSDEARKKKHKDELLPKFCQQFESFLTVHPGPYFCGTHFTFADVAVFQIVHNEAAIFGGDACEKDILANFPLLQAHFHAVASRPHIKAYIASPERQENLASLKEPAH